MGSLVGVCSCGPATSTRLRGGEMNTGASVCSVRFILLATMCSAMKWAKQMLAPSGHFSFSTCLGRSVRLSVPFWTRSFAGVTSLQFTSADFTFPCLAKAPLYRSADASRPARQPPSLLLGEARCAPVPSGVETSVRQPAPSLPLRGCLPNSHPRLIVSLLQ